MHALSMNSPTKLKPMRASHPHFYFCLLLLSVRLSLSRQSQPHNIFTLCRRALSSHALTRDSSPPLLIRTPPPLKTEETEFQRERDVSSCMPLGTPSVLTASAFVGCPFHPRATSAKPRSSAVRVRGGARGDAVHDSRDAGPSMEQTAPASSAPAAMPSLLPDGGGGGTNDGIYAVLFDMDGTLCDTDPIHHEVFSDLLLQHGKNGGVPIDDEFFRTHIAGRTNESIFAAIWPELVRARASVINR